MKNIVLLFMGLFSIVTFSQFKSGENIIISNRQLDDLYVAGETIKINAAIHGDLVAAAGEISINDSIFGDFTAVGGDLFINKYIEDDARITCGTAIIASDIGDDLIIFGGEVKLTKNAKVHGNLICYAGDIEINGEIKGLLNITGGNVTINGIAQGTSKIVGEHVQIGDYAKFYANVEYWSRDGEIDFKESLINATAIFKEKLRDDWPTFSWTTLGIASLFLWGFYILSAFLVILLLHMLFRNSFSKSVEILKKNALKSFGYGLIYLFGVPFLIALTFLMIIGIPIGLFIVSIFIFSLLFGHLIAALLLAFYVTQKNEKNWGFWSITFLALVFAIVMRLLTLLPFLGMLISIVILATTYGALMLRMLTHKNTQKLTT